MRCFMKAAALLLSNCVSGFVIPEHGALSGPSLDGVVEHRKTISAQPPPQAKLGYVGSHEALLKFAITTVESGDEFPVNHIPR
jgi:hypothetical protein